jgi:hypothetical protein
MPMRSVIHKEHRLVVTTGEGRVTLDEVFAHQNELLRDPDFNAEFDQLVDGTAITDVSMSVDEIRRAISPKVFSPASRLALVVSSPHVYGMMRMTQTYHEMSANDVPRMSIFHDYRSALKWLGIPEDSSLF